MPYLKKKDGVTGLPSFHDNHCRLYKSWVDMESVWHDMKHLQNTGNPSTPNYHVLLFTSMMMMMILVIFYVFVVI